MSSSALSPESLLTVYSEILKMLLTYRELQHEPELLALARRSEGDIQRLLKGRNTLGAIWEEQEQRITAGICDEETAQEEVHKIIEASFEGEGEFQQLYEQTLGDLALLSEHWLFASAAGDRNTKGGEKHYPADLKRALKEIFGAGFDIVDYWLQPLVEETRRKTALEPSVQPTAIAKKRDKETVELEHVFYQYQPSNITPYEKLLIANPDKTAQIVGILLRWDEHHIHIEIVPRTAGARDLSGIYKTVEQLGFKALSTGGMGEEVVAFLAKRMGRRVPEPRRYKPPPASIAEAMARFEQSMQNIEDASRGRVVDGHLPEPNAPEACSAELLGGFRQRFLPGGDGEDQLTALAERILNAPAFSRNDPTLRAMMAGILEEAVLTIARGEQVDLRSIDHSLSAHVVRGR